MISPDLYVKSDPARCWVPVARSYYGILRVMNEMVMTKQEAQDYAKKFKAPNDRWAGAMRLVKK